MDSVPAITWIVVFSIIFFLSEKRGQKEKESITERGIVEQKERESTRRRERESCSIFFPNKNKIAALYGHPVLDAM
jgi:hypothetical protein